MAEMHRLLVTAEVFRFFGYVFLWLYVLRSAQIDDLAAERAGPDRRKTVVEAGEALRHQHDLRSALRHEARRGQGSSAKARASHRAGVATLCASMAPGVPPVWASAASVSAVSPD